MLRCTQLAFNFRKVVPTVLPQTPPGANPFSYLISELHSLNEAIVQRQAAPDEIRRQAQYLLGSEHALRSLEPHLVSGDRAADLASYLPAFLPTPQETPARDFFPRVARIFNHHLDDVDRALTDGNNSNNTSSSASSDPSDSTSSPPRLCASIIECISRLGARERSTKKLPHELVATLNHANSLAMRLLQRETAMQMPTAVTVPTDVALRRCSARHVLSFLRGADVMLGGDAAFQFPRRGLPPLPMLPVKSKHDMERKALKYPVLHDLLRELDRRREQITLVDAHTGLRLMALVGVYHPEVIDTCVHRIVNGLSLSSSLQCAEAVQHLGVLGHRHVDARAIVGGCCTKTVGPRGLRKLLRGMAMLQLPFRTKEEVNKVHDHLWMYTMNPRLNKETKIEWHIDVAHALAAIQAHHYRFIVRTCRNTRNLSGYNLKRNPIPLDTARKAQLLWTIGTVVRTDVPSELDRDWKENVNRVKNALKNDALWCLSAADPETAGLLWQALERCGTSTEDLAKFRAGTSKASVPWEKAPDNPTAAS